MPAASPPHGGAAFLLAGLPALQQCQWREARLRSRSSISKQDHKGALWYGALQWAQPAETGAWVLFPLPQLRWYRRVNLQWVSDKQAGRGAIASAPITAPSPADVTQGADVVLAKIPQTC